MQRKSEPVLALRKEAEEQDKVIVRVIALGAGEYYGANSNGDYFPEDQLIPACKTMKDGAVRCYGYDTFVKNGKVYYRHQNKDPNNAIGEVLEANYNDKMHRVELTVAVDKFKAPDIALRLESGEKLPVSMGCRVEYDECSICGNRAYRSKEEWCEHGRTMLGQILEDGSLVCRINYAPIFHDISFVLVPADKTAYVIEKVAEETEDLEKLAHEVVSALGIQADPSTVVKIAEEARKDPQLLREVEQVKLAWEKGRPLSSFVLPALAAAILIELVRRRLASRNVDVPQEGHYVVRYPIVVPGPYS